MTVASLNKAIKAGHLPPVLFLYGDEPYLRQETLKQIEVALLAPGSADFNYHQYHGKGLKINELLEVALTFPVFADQRLIVVKEAQDLTAADFDALHSYLEDPATETCLVFSADKIDSRRKFFQRLKKLDSLVELKPLSERQLPGFVAHQLEEQGFSITGDALSLFVNRVGLHLQEVIVEIEKLTLYAGAPRLLDVADVQAVVSSVRAESIFEIGNAVGRQDVGRAVHLGRHLVADGEAPLKILALLTRHYRQLWKAREKQVEGQGGQQIARAVGVPPFVISGLVAQAKRYSRADFRRAFELFVEADLAMKSSGSQSEVVLENLLITLASKR